MKRKSDQSGQHGLFNLQVMENANSWNQVELVITPNLSFHRHLILNVRNAIQNSLVIILVYYSVKECKDHKNTQFVNMRKFSSLFKSVKINH